MREDFLNKNFIKYRKSLLYFSQKFNLPLQDIEEMVNDTILAALNSFDHDKGSFESYCRFILKNKIFNFKRDNKELFLLVVFDDLEEIFNSEEFTIEEKEKHNLAVKFLDRLKKILSGPELEFYNSIYASCDKKVKINISETSKNLGIDPKKGWDIFRRIQTKAVRLYKNTIPIGEEDADRFIKIKTQDLLHYLKIEESENIIEPIFSFHEKVQLPRDYDKFVSELTDLQIEKINKIYSS